jgi:hypothetical protein
VRILVTGVEGEMQAEGVREQSGEGKIGPKRDQVTREWRNYIIRKLRICTAHLVLCG